MTDYVIVGAGSAGCVLAARLSEDPAAQVTLIEAGGPDSAQEIHIPVAFPQLYKSHVDWDYMTEPEPGARRQARLPAARQGARRLELDQRHDLHSRPSRRLRRLGGGRRQGLELQRSPPLFHQGRGERARRGPVSREARAASGLRGPLAQSFDGRLRRGGGRGRPRQEPGFQRRRPGRRRALSVHPAQRHALQRRCGLSASRHGQAQSQADHQRAGDPDPVRRQAGDRRRDRRRRPPRRGPRRQGSDPRRRRLQFPAAAAPVGNRPGGGSRHAADLRRARTCPSASGCRTIR